MLDDGPETRLGHNNERLIINTLLKLKTASLTKDSIDIIKSQLSVLKHKNLGGF